MFVLRLVRDKRERSLPLSNTCQPTHGIRVSPKSPKGVSGHESQSSGGKAEAGAGKAVNAKGPVDAALAVWSVFNCVVLIKGHLLLVNLEVF